MDCFVGLGDVKAVAIGVGVDGDALDVQAAEGADDAAGDCSSIGYQNF